MHRTSPLYFTYLINLFSIILLFLHGKLPHLWFEPLTLSKFVAFSLKMIPHFLAGMGTKVQCKSYLPGYNNSMRDLNEDSNSSSWPHFYGDKSSLTNAQYYNNNFMPRTVTDSYPGYDKDVLKQKMLEHETIFKSQVYPSSTFYVIHCISWFS